MATEDTGGNIGVYELVSLIGAGGMGAVWRARLHRPGGARKILALKVLEPELATPRMRAAFLAEARTAMRMNHPNIVQTFDTGQDDGHCWIAMELVDGLDLARLVRRLGGPIPLPVAVFVVDQLLRALAHAHALEHDGAIESVIHRDISPHNVLVGARGEVKLSDFGIARMARERSNDVQGKLRYMAPEQLSGDPASAAMDLWAVGAVLHELVDGRPFRGDLGDELLAAVRDGLVPAAPPSLPPEIEAVRSALLARNPEQRPASAELARTMLRGWPGFAQAHDDLGALVQRARRDASADVLASQASIMTGTATEASHSAPQRTSSRAITSSGLLPAAPWRAAGIVRLTGSAAVMLILVCAAVGTIGWALGKTDTMRRVDTGIEVCARALAQLATCREREPARDDELLQLRADVVAAARDRPDEAVAMCEQIVASPSCPPAAGPGGP